MPEPGTAKPDVLKSVSAAHFSKNFVALLTETFEGSQGIYLDKQAGLFDTLDALSAEQASSVVYGMTIAAQVAHTVFYVRGMERYAEGFTGELDWQESWTTRSVTDAEWDALRAQLRGDYERAVHNLRAVTDWRESSLDFGMTIIVHSAYHLGAIRQLVKAVKEEV